MCSRYSRTWLYRTRDITHTRERTPVISNGFSFDLICLTRSIIIVCCPEVKILRNFGDREFNQNEANEQKSTTIDLTIETGDFVPVNHK